jgi:hypothetical protein
MMLNGEIGESATGSCGARLNDKLAKRKSLLIIILFFSYRFVPVVLIDIYPN